MDSLSFDDHIVKQFDDELESIRSQLLVMGGKVRGQLLMATKAIEDLDSELARQVIAEEVHVDEMEMEIDEACILIIVRRQPTASDLRFIIAVGRAVRDLERIGDEAKKIAVHALELIEYESTHGYREIRHISQSVDAMLKHALEAFARLDTKAAMKAFAEDEKIDEEYKTSLRELMTYMMEDPRSIKRVMNVMWVLRSLERIGDHAENLCEQIVFIVKGDDIRHGNL